MITEIYENLKQNKYINAIRKIMDSKLMMIAIVLLAALANIFSLEFLVYYIYLFLIITAVLFCDDLLSLMPIACCGYMTFSKKNNPASVEQTSAFLSSSSLIHFLIIGITTFIFVVIRICFDLKKHKDRRTMPKLLLGFVALGLTYILGGLFSPSYTFKSVFFGFIEILTLSFTYFCFYYTVDWKKVDKNYFAFLFTLIGFLMCIEVSNMLIEGGILETKGEFSRGNLYTGWGIYNNVASICIFTIPAPLYYTLSKKNGWKYILLSTLFLIFTIFTQSRNGMLIGTIVYCLGALIVLWKTKGKERIINLITYLTILLSVIIFLCIFNSLVRNMFSSIYRVGTDDSGRIEIYIDGLKQYLEYPILGNGFYACDSFKWGITNKDLFIPSRYHNTYVQILASCGTLGIIAYLYHRYETVKLALKSKNNGATIIKLSIIGFLLISIFDCHFHNLGPGFLYSALLLLLENVYLYKEN